MKKLALHSCCAPCLLGVMQALQTSSGPTQAQNKQQLGKAQNALQDYDQITAIFFNPNIEPSDEYDRRLIAFSEYVSSHHIDSFVVDKSELSSLLGNLTVPAPSLSVGMAENSTIGSKSPVVSNNVRCWNCYLQRLARVAQWAHENSYDGFATTLSISPWQNQAAINEAGRQVSEQFSQLPFVAYDFRDYYKISQRKARELGIYCQNYCGCLPSKGEADQQRMQRRSARKGP